MIKKPLEFPNGFLVTPSGILREHFSDLLVIRRKIDSILASKYQLMVRLASIEFKIAYTQVMRESTQLVLAEISNTKIATIFLRLTRRSLKYPLRIPKGLS